MPKPVTPLVGCDVFVVNESREVLLIRRSDNGFWALPGGCQDLGETPRQCAERECREETGLTVAITSLIGVFSSLCYEYKNYPWKENEFCHLLFQAKVVSGTSHSSQETTDVGWFSNDSLPPLSDGHCERIAFGFQALQNPQRQAHFE